MKNDNKKMLSVDEFIKKAESLGVDFGRGKPYNRLRYYTKMGWIPHMTRKGENVQGHYPVWVIDRLKMIQNLKKKGLSNEDITEEIEKTERLKPLKRIFLRDETKRKIIIAAVLIIILFLVLNELGLIQIGRTKEDLIPQREEISRVFP